MAKVAAATGAERLPKVVAAQAAVRVVAVAAAAVGVRAAVVAAAAAVVGARAVAAARARAHPQAILLLQSYMYLMATVGIRVTTNSKLLLNFIMFALLIMFSRHQQPSCALSSKQPQELCDCWDSHWV